MTFMSRKISNDLENMGATAGNTLATKQNASFFFHLFQRLVLYKIQD